MYNNCVLIKKLKIPGDGNTNDPDLTITHTMHVSNYCTTCYK